MNSENLTLQHSEPQSEVESLMTSEPLSQTAGREGGFGGGVTELCRGKWGGPGVCGVLEKARTAVGDVTTGRSVMFPAVQ